MTTNGSLTTHNADLTEHRTYDYRGGCQCGSLRYRFKGRPLTCYACHCTDCQSSSGSAFTLSMIVNRADIDVTSGDIAINEFIHNGTLVQRHHCESCGTAVWFAAQDYPQVYALKPGTFDDTGWFRPVAHLWTDSAQPWVKLDGSTKVFPTQPKMDELIDLWSARESFDRCNA